MFGWPAGTLIGQHASVVWPSLDAWKASTAVIGPKLKAGELVDAEFGDAPRWLHLPGPPDGSRAGPQPRQPGWHLWIMEDVTERRRTEQALAQARTTPRPPAAPRAPSWPTPATRSAPRSTACSAWAPGPARRHSRAPAPRVPGPDGCQRREPLGPDLRHPGPSKIGRLAA